MRRPGTTAVLFTTIWATMTARSRTWTRRSASIQTTHWLIRIVASLTRRRATWKTRLPSTIYLSRSTQTIRRRRPLQAQNAWSKHSPPVPLRGGPKTRWTCGSVFPGSALRVQTGHRTVHSRSLLNFQPELLDQRRPLSLLAFDVGRVFFGRTGDRIAAVGDNAPFDFLGHYDQA